MAGREVVIDYKSVDSDFDGLDVSGRYSIVSATGPFFPATHKDGDQETDGVAGVSSSPTPGDDRKWIWDVETDLASFFGPAWVELTPDDLIIVGSPQVFEVTNGVDTTPLVNAPPDGSFLASSTLIRASVRVTTRNPVAAFVLAPGSFIDLVASGGHPTATLLYIEAVSASSGGILDIEQIAGGTLGDKNDTISVVPGGFVRRKLVIREGGVPVFRFTNSGTGPLRVGISSSSVFSRLV